MSLQPALELLQLAKNTFKIKKGPFDKGTHCLTLDKSTNMLVLSLNTGTEFRNFSLDENDLSKEPEDLIVEIYNIIENIKKLN